MKNEEETNASGKAFIIGVAGAVAKMERSRERERKENLFNVYSAFNVTENGMRASR